MALGLAALAPASVLAAFPGNTAGDSSGGSVSAAGDVNGDGVADVIIGAPGADPNGRASGASYVVFGQGAGTTPPVAAADAYRHFGSDTPLVVPAPGVLGNDDEFLTAVQVSGPSNGTLTLNSDGSFNYQPNEDFVGADSFTYKANDGTEDSNEATVTITVGAGCNGLQATIVGTSASETLRGTAGDDVIAGLGGNDELRGSDGNDTLCGGSGDDKLCGGAGNDRLDGGSWSDVLFGGLGNDRLLGRAGADRLRGGAGNDRLFGGSGSDVLFGQAGADTLAGGAGSPDSCQGGDGPDSLAPGHGCEQVIGIP
ncbi:MAG: Ig-like domain-containing protein [Aestuariivirga sp.]